MKVVHVTTYPGGGAGIAARRLSDGLNALGVESRLFTLDELPSPGALEKLRRAFVYRLDSEKYNGYTLTPQTEIFTHPFSLYDLAPAFASADVVHLHWVSRFVNQPTFFRRLNQPMVWTLHDMNAFTGGCHYSEGCDGFLSGCTLCPQLPEAKLNEAERNFVVKKKAFNFLPKTTPIVCPSQWLHDWARKSVLLGRFSHHHIPNGLDLENAFFPENKTAAKKALGLADKPTALFVADRLDSRWKGFVYLREALKIIRQNMDFQAVAVGGQALQDDDCVYLGRCDGEKMRTAYNAADVFVIPSLEDNLPNTPIEAAACGVPSVGFAAGGIPEIIVHGETGFVVPKRDVPMLAQVVTQLLQNPQTAQSMGAAARKRAETVFPLEKQARAYLTLYQTLVSGRTPSVD